MLPITGQISLPDIVLRTDFSKSSSSARSTDGGEVASSGNWDEGR